jgi:hypothetical protein
MDLGTSSRQQHLGTESLVAPDRAEAAPSPAQSDPEAELVAAGRVDIRL